METVQELVPFAREMWSQKPGRGMLRVYLVGSALALVGTLLGLVDAVCQPFSASPADDDALDAELARLVARERRPGDAAPEKEAPAAGGQRSAANRLHAS
ncbi:G0/G1 switch protein 2-like [Denticeps clupeoides]|uniref:G0/G1 switch protein 2-like n=1 Tax=Denticeps clupeoides TaxID=299321 RepID=UPI0010A2D421|nr:G0/G1 switch protein 2 [Denticeps clupeoides]